MDGTTKEQNRIRRGTLFISILLLFSSLGCYFVYQNFFQPELHVTFVSKKVLPNTKPAGKSSQKVENTQSNKKSEPAAKELTPDPLSQSKALNTNRVKQTTPMNTSFRIFKLSDRIETIPIMKE